MLTVAETALTPPCVPRHHRGGAEWRREINKQVNKLKVRDVRTIVGHAMGAVPDRVLDEKPPLA